jgi:hypothetical protein
VMNGGFEFFPERFDMFRIDARDEQTFFARGNFRGDADNLLRRFSGGENDFGKTFAKGAMQIDFGIPEINHRRALKGVQDFFARNFPVAKLVQKLGGFSSRHTATMP